jgi:3-oxoacyl-[acyl-carrier-protein] synthase III
MSAYLQHLSYALGEACDTVEEAAAKGRTVSSAARLREAGFERHHVCPPEQGPYDLAFRAVQPLQDRLADTGAIVYSTCIPLNGNVGRESCFHATRDVKYLMDFPASHLQADFGLDRAFVLGLNQQACTSLLGSLRLAGMLLADDAAMQQVLCVTADRFPEGALYEQAYNLISDGAAACVVGREPRGFRILSGHALTNGALARADDDETVGSYFSYTHRLITEAVRKAGLQLADIDWIVSQNMNIKAWQILSRLLKFDMEKVCFPTLPEAGHVISGDNILNLKRMDESGRLEPGDRLLLVMSGYGLNWQSVLLEKVSGEVS